MKFSIVTINYNNANGLRQTMDSIISQRCDNYEWIVIDGGSTDGSEQLIQENSCLFAYWCSEPDKGVYDAMNKGISHTTGEYIIFMNSGDVFFDEYVLEKVQTYRPTAEVVYGNWTWKYNDEKEIPVNAPDTVNLAFFLRTNICHQAIFVSGENIRAKGFDLEFPFYADWAKWIEMMVNGCSFQHIPVSICRYEMGGMSDANRKKAELELEQIQRKYLPKYILAIKDEIDIANTVNESKVLKDTYRLVTSGKLYKKLIHANVRIVKLLHNILSR